MASGVSAKMIRYYESIGLLVKAERSAGGYRMYTSTDIDFLKFVRRARDLGFPLARVEAMVRLWRDVDRPVEEIDHEAQMHLVEVRGKMADIEAVAHALESLTSAGNTGVRPESPEIPGTLQRL